MPKDKDCTAQTWECHFCGAVKSLEEQPYYDPNDHGDPHPQIDGYQRTAPYPHCKDCADNLSDLVKWSTDPR